MVNYTVESSKDVGRKHVRYNNCYELTIAVDLYQAGAIDGSEAHPAIIVGVPYGDVKEQGPYVYANELTRRGSVVLTSDRSFMGESAREPRDFPSPEISTGDFSAVVDYLGVKVPYAGCDKIGVVGICGPGGFALSAIQADTKVKTVATTNMHIMTTVAHGTQDRAVLAEMKERLSLRRQEDFGQGYPECIPSSPEEPVDIAPGGMPEPGVEWFRFYAVRRDYRPNAKGGFATTSDLAFLNADLTALVGEISPRPVLFIADDRVHSKFFSKMVYEEAQESKEPYVVEDVEHIDLYGRADRISFGKLERFFRENL